MSEANKLNEKQVIESIKNGKPVELTFPVINNTIQEAFHFIFTNLLEHYDRVDLMEVMYSTFKELVINGIKANIKHYYFKEQQIDMDSQESVQKGYSLLKEKLNDVELYKFEEIAQHNNLELKISILHSFERIITLVENNTPMSAMEDKRIRDKFSKALKYDNIAEFYMDYADDIEGSGLGITMIVLMLKGQGIDPHAFTINTQNKKSTIAKIEFPLNDNYTINRNS